MSLIEEFEIVKGDSSDVYMFNSKDYPVFDANWSASYNIREKDVNGTVLVQRDLSLNAASADLVADSNFVFQIYPTESDLLPVGKHFLTVEIKNLSINYREELVQSKIKVLPNGIDNV